jgi:hypothetical protein
MASRSFTADDQRNPVYCMGCKNHTPSAELFAHHGYCYDCWDAKQRIPAAAIPSVPPVINPPTQQPQGPPIGQPYQVVYVAQSPQKGFWPTPWGWVGLIAFCIICPVFPLLVGGGAMAILGVLMVTSPVLSVGLGIAATVCLVLGYAIPPKPKLRLFGWSFMASAAVVVALMIGYYGKG